MIGRKKSPTWRWQVQARVPEGHFYYSMIVDRLDRETADLTADFYAKRYPHWEIRLLDEATGEIVHYVREAA